MIPSKRKQIENKKMGVDFLPTPITFRASLLQRPYEGIFVFTFSFTGIL